MSSITPNVKGTMRKYFLGLMATYALLFPTMAESQTPKRVGVLVAHDQFIPAFEGFKKKMADLGYIEGKNIVYDFNNAHANTEALDTLAKKLAQDKPDLLVAASDAAAAALASFTKDNGIPVVFLSVSDPLRLVKSHASSGNNLTGISSTSIDLTEKRIELLRELVPGIKRAISLHYSQAPNYKSNLHSTREAAKKFGINLVEGVVASPEELIQRAPVVLTRKTGEAVIYPPERIVFLTQKIISPQLIRERLPSIAAGVASVYAGALATYAADYFALGTQGAIVADSIFKGARPSELPIQQPFKLKLVINVKTAKAIGLKVPKETLLRADEVIE